MSKLKKLLYIVSWIVPALFKLVAWAVGLVVIPFALVVGSDKRWERKGSYFPKLFFLWDNKEEGVPDWWLRVAPDKNVVARLFPRWWWFAMRNPVNGMRYIFEDREPTYEGWGGEPMEANDLIEANVKKASRWAYNGVFAGYRRVWLNGNNKYSEFWFGWKVGSKVPGMGFAAQLRLKRDIGS